VEDSCEHGNEPSGSIEGSSGVASQLVASQEGLSSMKLLKDHDEVKSNEKKRAGP
jgi:hypothetical protein